MYLANPITQVPPQTKPKPNKTSEIHQLHQSFTINLKQGSKLCLKKLGGCFLFNASNSKESQSHYHQPTSLQCQIPILLKIPFFDISSLSSISKPHYTPHQTRHQFLDTLPLPPWQIPQAPPERCRFTFSPPHGLSESQAPFQFA